MKKAAILAIGAQFANPGLATPRFPPLHRVPVLEQALPSANPPVRMIRGAKIRFAPGQPTGTHCHPVSTVGVVSRGSFVFAIEGERPRTLRTGDTFFEPAGATIARFDNASQTAAAAITVFYLVDTKDRPLIEMLAVRQGVVPRCRTAG